jgi:hypothetical protein
VIGRKCKCDRGVIFGLLAESHFGEWENRCSVGGIGARALSMTSTIFPSSCLLTASSATATKQKKRRCVAMGMVRAVRSTRSEDFEVNDALGFGPGVKLGFG